MSTSISCVFTKYLLKILHIQNKFLKYSICLWPISSRPSSSQFLPLRGLYLFQRDLYSDRKPLTTWTEPDGYDTGVLICNSLIKSKVPLKTIYPGVLTWYNCGPTVYDSPHIGHGMCFVKFDIIRRILENIFDLQVIQVTNVTDIDDKIINRAKQLNLNVNEITRKYEDEFFRDIKRLNVLPPTLSPRVTDHIPHIIAFIKRIMDNGLAYNVEETVYFDTFKWGSYGKFVEVDQSEQLHRIRDSRKKNPQDFALWKSPKSPDEPFWNSPWGPGRPGWHIECSAMAYQVFGGKLDLHSGGKDLMFPHHENEEAQCCAYNSSSQWCNYWIHAGHLHLKDSCKMSKSLQNTISIDQFLEDNSANIFRLFCLLSHYKTDTEFSSESLSKSENYFKKIVSFFQSTQAFLSSQVKCGPFSESAVLQELSRTKAEVRLSLADDFNTQGAILYMMDFITFCNKSFIKSSKDIGTPGSLGTISLASNYVYNTLESLGMKFQPYLPNSVHLFGLEKKLYNILDSTVQYRNEVKKFALLHGSYSKQSICKEEMNQLRVERKALIDCSDDLRKSLNNIGINITDHDGGSSWSFHEEKNDSTKSET